MSGRKSTALLGIVAMVTVFSAGASALEKRNLADREPTTGIERGTASAVGKSAEAIKQQGEWLARQGEALKQQGEALQQRAEELKQKEQWLTQQVRMAEGQANTFRQHARGFLDSMVDVGQKLFDATKGVGSWLETQLDRLSQQWDRQVGQAGRTPSSGSLATHGAAAGAPMRHD